MEVTGERTKEKLHVGQPILICLPGAGLGRVRWAQARCNERRRKQLAKIENM